MPKWNNAPLYYTVAQVQFNPILNLDSYLPAIQSKMREAHFPDYRHEVVQRLVLPFLGGESNQGAAPTVGSQSRYTFGDIDGRTSFLLESSTLSLQTTAYDTFEIFASALLRGLSILHEAIHLDFVDRIGLRYLDAVLPINEGDTLQNLLVPEVLGHSHNGQGQLQQSVSETISITSAGQLVARVIIRHGRIGLPTELAALAPAIAPDFAQREGLHAIVDTDAFFARREIFDLAKIEDRLTSLHDEIMKSFRATVTPQAEAAWA